MGILSFRNASPNRNPLLFLLSRFFAMSTSGNNEDQNPTRKHNNEENPTRKGKGRRKVPMAKMENEANLQVTFSKRRNGLFKKASEISTRCGAESALVVYSPGGKPFSFGHPNVERVISRFLDEDDHNSPPTADELIALENERHMIANANAELNGVVDQMDVAKNQAKELEQIDKQLGKIKQIKDLNYHQLDELKGEVLDFKNKLGKDEEAKHESFTGTPYTFLGPSPNLGTATDFQLVQPTGSGSSFDPRFGSNLPVFSDQFPHCFGSGGINLFGNNVPLAAYDPSFAGTSSTSNFSAHPGYIPMWNASSSSFVIPYTPLSTNPTATIPIHSTENESSGHIIENNNVGAPKDRNE
ncbi:agamous-like MADS-box protein AGL13 [Primulina tabacum]|uniref:agamous-like MADS-box protein AGL13 n=1 Tax=Primulina tabacum TaxID=48773 RepID=UPI003F5A8DCB